MPTIYHATKLHAADSSKSALGGSTRKRRRYSQQFTTAPMTRKVFSGSRGFIAIAIAIACGVLVLFGNLPDHLILFPSRNPIDPRGAVRRVVPFENGQLELWTAKSRAAQKSGVADVYVLRFYGNADRAERWVAAEADTWNERAVEIWGMNYPGFGGSSGPAKLS